MSCQCKRIFNWFELWVILILKNQEFSRLQKINQSYPVGAIKVIYPKVTIKNLWLNNKIEKAAMTFVSLCLILLLLLMVFKIVFVCPVTMMHTCCTLSFFVIPILTEKYRQDSSSATNLVYMVTIKERGQGLPQFNLSPRFTIYHSSVF